MNNGLNVFIEYLLGSDLYKQQHKDSFKRILGEHEFFDLVALAGYSHLLSLFYAELVSLGIKDKADFLEPYITHQKMFNKAMKQAILELNDGLKGKKLNPVILKGPSLWERIYKEDFYRRIRDLDILIYNKDEIRDYCAFIEDHGFVATGDYSASIEDSKTYELSNVFKKFYNIEVDQEEAVKLDELIASDLPFWGTLRMKKVESGVYSFEIGIEVHKAPFLYSDYTFPELEDSYFTSIDFANNIKRMKNSLILPYLAFKIIADNAAASVRSLKLVGDFIRILYQSNEADIEESIEIASNLYLVDEYLSVLNAVNYLVPEVTFDDLEDDEKESPVANMINLLMNRVV